MRIFSLGLLLGTLILQQIRHLPSHHWAWLIAVAFLLPWRYPWWRAFAAFLIGVSWTLLYASWRLDHRLPESFEAQTIRVQGWVLGLPVYQNDHIQFMLRPLSMHKNDGAATAPVPPRLPNKIKLNWYHSREPLVPGQFIDVSVKLKRPNGLMNPAGFDYETWLFIHGVDAVGYVRQRYPVTQPRMSSNTADRLNRARQRLLTELQQQLAGMENAGLIMALVIGERFAIKPEQWQLLQSTGTNHLLAISGMHIGLIAALAFFISRRIWPRLAANSTIPAQRVAALVALLAAFTYSALAGFSVPTQRALIMIMVLLLAQWRQRPSLPSQSLAFALAVVLLVNPLTVLESGFWLSFMAVASLMYSLSPRARLNGFYQRWLLPQFAVFFGLSGFLLLQFGQLPLLSPLANLVAIPLVSFVTLPLSLAALPLLWLAPGLAHLVLMMADQSLTVLQWFLSAFDSVHWQLQMPAQQALWPGLLAYAGVFLAMLPVSASLRLAAFCLSLPLLFTPAKNLAEGSFKVVFFDVGQGLSVLVATREHVMVYDSGPRYSKNFDAAKAVIVPMLRQLGYRKIDRLLLSHHDSDHVGATFSLLRNFTVEHISTTWSSEYSHAVNDCQANQHWTWNHVEFRVLYPPANLSAAESDNNHSCVIKISAGKHQVLLTGDIESKVERLLVSQLSADELRADIMLVPHHGSKSSSSAAFIAKVAPQWAIASNGYLNRFGFPKPEIVERYLQSGIAFLSTSHYGALTFLIDGFAEPRLLHAERIDKSHYWHQVPLSNNGVRK